MNDFHDFVFSLCPFIGIKAQTLFMENKTQQQKTNSDLCAPIAIPQHIFPLSDMDFVPESR